MSLIESFLDHIDLRINWADLYGPMYVDAWC